LWKAGVPAYCGGQGRYTFAVFRRSAGGKIGNAAEERQKLTEGRGPWARIGACTFRQGHSFARFSITVQKPSHIADDGSISMVDVSGKTPTTRTARAQARVCLGPDAAAALRDASLTKGDAFAAAQIAGILAAKQTPALIPLAHAIPLAKVDVSFSWDGDVLVIETFAQTVAQTGVEMEAMVAASVSALTIYDMAKAVNKGITIESVRLLSKTGGKSGRFDAARPFDNAQDDEGDA
jgi:cyclic pyranopterin phosphate synthase